MVVGIAAAEAVVLVAHTAMVHTSAVVDTANTAVDSVALGVVHSCPAINIGILKWHSLRPDWPYEHGSPGVSAPAKHSPQVAWMAPGGAQTVFTGAGYCTLPVRWLLRNSRKSTQRNRTRRSRHNGSSLMCL